MLPNHRSRDREGAIPCGRGSLCLFVLCLLFGCSNAPPLPKTFPVTGTVAYQDGKPLNGGSIQLKSASDPLLRVVGDIQSDGSFKLKTIKDAIADGAPEGEYQVIITLPRPGHDPNDPAAAQKRQEPITLEKAYKIEAKPNTLKIELPSPGPA
ncbi:MAG TPA: hypothetical protein VFE62_11880 [Gemmataceae bacterium]|nr:hypothetical protein [Gemmataceae bacterium]